MTLLELLDMTDDDIDVGDPTPSRVLSDPPDEEEDICTIHRNSINREELREASIWRRGYKGATFNEPQLSKISFFRKYE